MFCCDKRCSIIYVIQTNQLAQIQLFCADMTISYLFISFPVHLKCVLDFSAEKEYLSAKIWLAIILTRNVVSKSGEME